MENYVKGLAGSGRYTYATYFSNSAFVTILSTLARSRPPRWLAFGFARIPFKKKNFWFALLMGTMLLPSQVLVVPQYMVFKSLGWLNTYLPLIIPQFCGSAFFIFLNMQFMRGVPSELDEAAKIDGCGWFQHLFERAAAPVGPLADYPRRFSPSTGRGRISSAP